MIAKLSKIQQALKAPKNQFNDFGKYKYRSCEDILEAVKPLLGDLVLTLSDEVVEVGGRVYVKATAKIWGEVATEADRFNGSFTVCAFAREPEDRKGMDSSQITGTASSYARKYALNGLFLIDDTKDADTMDNRKPEKEAPKKEPIKTAVDAGVAVQKKLKADLSKAMGDMTPNGKKEFFAWLKEKYEGEGVEQLQLMLKDIEILKKEWVTPVGIPDDVPPFDDNIEM